MRIRNKKLCGQGEHEVRAPDDVSIETATEPFTKTDTIVGYIQERYWADHNLGLYSMLTFADGSQGDALWHRVFVKSAARDALNL